MGVVRGDNSLFFATGIDNTRLKSGANEAVGLIQGMTNKISKINPFAALGVGALAAFTLVSNSAYKLAKDYEHAMKEVQTISSAANKDFKGLSRDILNISKTTPEAPEKLAKAFYQIASAGYDGAEGLDILRISAKSAVAGVTDTITAADGITTILNAYKIQADETESVSDSLFNTVKLGKTTFSELAASISNVAPIAAASDIPLNQLLSHNCNLD